MKQSIKSNLMRGLYHCYAPIVTRVEKLRAFLLWRDGVKQCWQMHKEVGNIRVYLFFDAKHFVWSPMTWRANKAFKPAYLQMRTMGKIRASRHIKTVRDAQESCFYYTHSKNGAKGCQQDNALRTEKLQLWMSYYLGSLSQPMMKLRKFRLKYFAQCQPDSASEQPLPAH